MWNPDERTQIVYEKKTDRVRPHGPIFPRQLVSHTPTHWITQEALLDMIDAIDADMNARPGDAELILWIVHQSTLRTNFAASCATTAAGPNVHARFQELDPQRGGETLRRVLLGSRVQLRTCQSGLHQFVAPRMQTARNIEPLAGASSIGRRWSSVSFSQKQNAFWRRDSRGASRARCRRQSQRQRARGARDGATGRRSQQRQ